MPAEKSSNTATDQHGTGPVSDWVARFLPLVRSGGTVLDLACGKGRHAIHAARLGYQVTAIDRNAEALGQLRNIGGITPIEHDLETEDAAIPLSAGSLDGIIVTNYLHRPLFGQLAGLLAPGGVLIYETFAIGNEQFGKPSNPAFLLAEGELLQVFGSLTVIAFEQGIMPRPQEAVRQRICCVRERPPAGTACPQP